MAAGCGTLLVAAPTASAIDDINTKRLREQVTVAGNLQHERVFQSIANKTRANPADQGTRASGTPGYDESLAYVRKRMQAAGYRVRTQRFKFPFYREVSSSISQVSPTPTEYETAAYEY
jgi:hypothetical protein